MLAADMIETWMPDSKKGAVQATIAWAMGFIPLVFSTAIVTGMFALTRFLDRFPAVQNMGEYTRHSLSTIIATALLIGSGSAFACNAIAPTAEGDESRPGAGNAVLAGGGRGPGRTPWCGFWGRPWNRRDER